MTLSRTTLRTVGMVVLTVVVAVALFLLGDTDGPAPSSVPAVSGAVSPSSMSSAGGEPGPESGDVDPESGLTWVELEDLPGVAQDVVEDIEQGGPFVCEKDGSTFGNYEGVLPQRERGYYAEFTVIDDCSRNRGALRIVAGDADELYFTDDHYDSFDRVLPDQG
ncbi:hypothetical protein NPS01_07600 [Nocardioides psychrotolerans]|uniref:Ribonuclease T1 n=1 Tax=Nocardioides psychrotolerans TaxID=1005945 RepID=A0A1I3D9K7_9ACTN|nr:ribonuclease domain-containing protein [Nocardioides psychrotolerans]GEP37097.1 hypothetical protein NPS01_07600 [Nocardioides psychrotolerans]SFH83385.1 ribonuclease T1 [Nocardioides psychrotolerans]